MNVEVIILFKQTKNNKKQQKLENEKAYWKGKKHG